MIDSGAFLRQCSRWMLVFLAVLAVTEMAYGQEAANAIKIEYCNS